MAPEVLRQKGSTEKTRTRVDGRTWRTSQEMGEWILPTKEHIIYQTVEHELTLLAATPLTPVCHPFSFTAPCSLSISSVPLSIVVCWNYVVIDSKTVENPSLWVWPDDPSSSWEAPLLQHIWCWLVHWDFIPIDRDTKDRMWTWHYSVDDEDMGSIEGCDCEWHNELTRTFGREWGELG